LIKAGVDAIRRVIREQEPVRPSTRVSVLARDELSTTALLRGANPPWLVHQLKGDLDWIVMKCLEKDRTRRYDTAVALAADIKRHLANEAVLARPPSALYRLQKLLRRNKLAVTVACGVLAGVLLGLLLALWLALGTRPPSRLQTDPSVDLNKPIPQR
jgi:hypothetical protein